VRPRIKPISSYPRYLVRSGLTSSRDAIYVVQGPDLLRDKSLLDIGIQTRALNTVNRYRLFRIDYSAEIEQAAAAFTFPKNGFAHVRILDDLIK
jgi:hypothetical protein